VKFGLGTEEDEDDMVLMKRYNERES
jgi:hypothetical protein